MGVVAGEFRIGGAAQRLVGHVDDLAVGDVGQSQSELLNTADERGSGEEFFDFLLVPPDRSLERCALGADLADLVLKPLMGTALENPQEPQCPDECGTQERSHDRAESDFGTFFLYSWFRKSLQNPQSRTAGPGVSA